MVHYTEFADMHVSYGAGGCSGWASQHRTPNIIPWSKLTATPSLHAYTKSCPRADPSTQWCEQTVKSVANKETVLELVQDTSGVNVLVITSHVGISYSRSGRSCMHLYHIQHMQLLEVGNFAPQLAFTCWYLQIHIEDLHFPSIVLFINEVTFTWEGM